MERPKIKPSEILPLFDVFLATKNASFDAIVIGGAALNIMGVIPRETSDFDILDPVIPKNILDLASEFRNEMNKRNINLAEKWFNNGPVSVKSSLPKGWQMRLQTIFTGNAITFQTLGRSDLLITKLDACCTRVQPDLNDLIEMKPSKEELQEAKKWVLTIDEGSQWPDDVKKACDFIAIRLGYEL